MSKTRNINSEEPKPNWDTKHLATADFRARLTESGVKPEDAFHTIDHSREMAESNAVRNFQAEVQCLREKIETQLDAHNSKYNLLLWLVGGVVLLTLYRWSVCEPSENSRQVIISQPKFSR